MFDVWQGSDTTKTAYGKVTSHFTSGWHTEYVVTMTMTAEDAPIGGGSAGSDCFYDDCSSGGYGLGADCG